MSDAPAPAAPAATPSPASATPPEAAAPSAPAPPPPAPAAASSTEVPAAEIGNLIADAKADGEAAKPAEETPTETKPAEPPTYPNLKLPEGVKADDPALAQFTKDFSEAGLSETQVQSLVDKYAGKLVPVEDMQKAIDGPNQLWKDTQQQWVKEVKSDPEVGGANFQANLAGIAKVIDQFGGKESASIRKAFNFTGAGNNPEIVRFLHRVSKALNVEGSTIPAGKPTSINFQTAATRLYGKPE